MPLKEGSSREVVSENIATEMHHGHPQEQAIAIAMMKARLSNQPDAAPKPVQPEAAPTAPSSLPTTVSPAETIASSRGRGNSW